MQVVDSSGDDDVETTTEEAVSKEVEEEEIVFTDEGEGWGGVMDPSLNILGVSNVTVVEESKVADTTDDGKGEQHTSGDGEAEAVLQDSKQRILAMLAQSKELAEAEVAVERILGSLWRSG